MVQQRAYERESPANKILKRCRSRVAFDLAHLFNIRGLESAGAKTGTHEALVPASGPLPIFRNRRLVIARAGDREPIDRESTANRATQARTARDLLVIHKV